MKNNYMPSPYTAVHDKIIAKFLNCDKRHFSLLQPAQSIRFFLSYIVLLRLDTNVTYNVINNIKKLIPNNYYMLYRNAL